MSKLTVLKDKDPKEAARLLSIVSSSLLPNPGVSKIIVEGSSDLEFAKAVLTEIRNHLRIPEGDNSVKTHSRIYAFLSEEISKAAMTNVDLSKVKARLGNKGELHPSQYQVRFKDYVSKIEVLGVRKAHMIEAVTHPDKVANLQPKYLQEDEDPRLTISIKYITSKRIEDNFILFVISQRRGHAQVVAGAFRVYQSDVRLKDSREPLDIIKSFADTYGIAFRLGSITSKFMHNEIVGLETDMSSLKRWDFIPVDKEEGAYYWPFIGGGHTQIQHPGSELLGEVVLGFMVDVSKYVRTLHKHNVYIPPDVMKTLYDAINK